MEFILKCTGIFIQFFCLLTPFFVMSMFLTMTGRMDNVRQRAIAVKTTVAILCICFFIYFLGSYLFQVLGLTLDAFRIGAGALLFLTAVSLVQEKGKGGPINTEEENDNISVVPLAIPFTVGPGTIGAIMVMSAESSGFYAHFVGCAGLTLAILCTGILLLLSGLIKSFIGEQGIKILSKITGLILAALAAQIVFTGIKNFLNL